MLLVIEYLSEADQRLFSYQINRKVLNFNKVLQVERKTLLGGYCPEFEYSLNILKNFLKSKF